MSGPSKRDRAVAEMERALRRARLSLEPDLGDVGLLVDLIVDAAAERIRAEVGSGPTPLREGLKPFADASWARNEVAYRYLNLDGKDEARGTTSPRGDGVWDWVPYCRCGGLHYDSETPDRCTQCGRPFRPKEPGTSDVEDAGYWKKDV